MFVCRALVNEGLDSWPFLLQGSGGTRLPHRPVGCRWPKVEVLLIAAVSMCPLSSSSDQIRPCGKPACLRVMDGFGHQSSSTWPRRTEQVRKRVVLRCAF